MKEQDITKVEFLLMCNDNIVVQRFFNVRGFNRNAHKSEEQFLAFTERLGLPDFVMFLCCEESSIKERYCKKNEIEEVNEDALENIRSDN